MTAKDKETVDTIKRRCLEIARSGGDPWHAGSITDTGQYSGLYASLPREQKAHIAAWTDGLVNGLAIARMRSEQNHG